MPLAALLFAYAASRLFWLIDGQAWPILSSYAGSGLLQVGLFGGGSVVAVMAGARLGLADALRFLGLNAPPWKGLRFGLLATAPMALVAATSAEFRLDASDLAGNVVLGPFAEEVLFRGLLFTVLYRLARWPLSLALLVSAALFGIAHAPNLGQRLIVQVMFSGLGEGLLVWAFGGALFAWVFHRLGSLWPAVGLHACMNLWWTIGGGDTRGPHADVLGAAQAASFVLAVLLTIRPIARAPRRCQPARAPASPSTTSPPAPSASSCPT